MSRDWQPGDMALLTLNKPDGTGEGGDRLRHVAVRDQVGSWASGTTFGRMVHDSQVVAARPLVVLDPDDREQVERLVRALPLDWALEQPDDPDLFHESVDQVAAALRSLMAPPKPEEPTGLGAVVEDSKGNRWVRAFALRLAWTDTLFSEDCREYADIDAVRVLSEGVQP